MFRTRPLLVYADTVIAVLLLGVAILTIRTVHLGAVPGAVVAADTGITTVFMIFFGARFTGRLTSIGHMHTEPVGVVVLTIVRIFTTHAAVVRAANPVFTLLVALT